MAYITIDQFQSGLTASKNYIDSLSSNKHVEYFYMRAWYDYSTHGYTAQWDEEEDRRFDAMVDAYYAGKAVKLVLTTSNEDIYWRNVLDLVRYNEQGEEPFNRIYMVFANDTIDVSTTSTTNSDQSVRIDARGFKVVVYANDVSVREQSLGASLAYASQGVNFTQRTGQVSIRKSDKKDRNFKIIQQTPTSDTLEIEATYDYLVDPDDDPDSGDEYKETQYEIKASLATTDYVDTKIADELARFDRLDYQIVDVLPTTGEQGVRYLVKHPTDAQYEEYIYVNDAWHDIGSTSNVNLDNYYNKTETDALLIAKADTATVTSLTDRIAALEAKLADFTEVTFKMSDGTNEVDKLILAKDKATPPTPTRTMFDLPSGLYDAQGNKVHDLDDSIAAHEYYSGFNYTIRFYDDLPTGVVGVSFADENEWFKGIESDGGFYPDWIVLPNNGGVNDSAFHIDTNSIGTIYYQGNSEYAPWGTGATIDTVGNIPWEV